MTVNVAFAFRVVEIHFCVTVRVCSFCMRDTVCIVACARDSRCFCCLRDSRCFCRLRESRCCFLSDGEFVLFLQVTSSSCYSPVVKKTCFQSSVSDDLLTKLHQVQLSIPAGGEAAEKQSLQTSCGI